METANKETTVNSLYNTHQPENMEGLMRSNRQRRVHPSDADSVAFKDQPVALRCSNRPHAKARKDISIFGLGYVGTVSMACFSALGHSVIGVDKDEQKVNCLNRGESPVYEKDLSRLLHLGRQQGRLTAMKNVRRAVLASDISLVSVGTPSLPNGDCNLEHLTAVTHQIGEVLREKKQYHLIVFRSTVPPKTTREVLIPILETSSGLQCGVDFGVVFNPEFLRESTAVDDFRNPPKTVVGASDENAAAMAMSLYESVDGPKIKTSIECAEFVKYVDNTWHALKVSFGNEVGRLCKAAGVDSHEVMDVFMQDTKLNISGHYLKPGFAFGGSCLPKDVRGITALAERLCVDLPVIRQINASNRSHLQHTLSLIERLNGESLGIFGLTFKPGTDDLRESPSLALLKELKQRGEKVYFFDPCVTENSCLDNDMAVNALLHESRCDDIDSLVSAADKLLIAHDDVQAEVAAKLCGAGKPVLDVVRSDRVRSAAKSYEGICW